MDYSNCEPANGDFECMDMKNQDFKPIFRFISAMVQDREIVTTKRQ